MHSRSAAAITGERVRRLAALTPEERIRLAERLGEEGLAFYIQAHGVDRPTAVAQIKATRRLGRRVSRCAEADER